MSGTAESRAQSLAKRLSLPISAYDSHALQILVEAEAVSVQMPGLGKPIFIDFCAGKYDHRRKFGGGRGQALARAVGLKQGVTPSVIDATAGFARDAFVLASLGCPVVMLEQSPIMSLLIEDALLRAQQAPAITDIIERMQIIHTNAIAYLQQLDASAYSDVIYLDPMYPSREKSALVKKEMQFLHQLIGADNDSDQLLTLARGKARKRVVVKRPKGAEYLGGQKPSVSIESKNTRYDIYPTG